MNLDEERFVPKQVTWVIAGAKEDGLRPKDMEVAATSRAASWSQVYEAYEAQCQREGVVDFAELMLRTYELMRDNAALREHYQRRFRHILVDEFQDTNKLQYAWLKMFAGPPEHGCALFAVGDDDQSIYAFRGAQVGNMAAFEREFQVQQVIKLERNYRSYGNILDAANELISHNSRRLGKNLRTEAGPGEPVRVREATSDFAEAQWFVEEAQQLHREGTPRNEIALLYRSNAQSRVMESALFNAGIPYKVYGGLRFFERAEVKHALSYLRLIENPNDDTSFLRVVNFPARGIGARTHRAAAGRRAGQRPQPLAERRRGRRQGRRATCRPSSRRIDAHARGDARPRRCARSSSTCSTPRAWSSSTRPTAKARTGSRTSRSWSTPPRPSSRRRASARTPSRCRSTRGPARRSGRAQPGSRSDRVHDAGRRGRRERRGRVATPRLTPDAETGEIMSPLAAFLTHAVARSRRQPGPGRAGRDPADDGAFGQGPGVRLRLHHRPRGGPVPARELGQRPRRAWRKSAA